MKTKIYSFAACLLLLCFMSCQKDHTDDLSLEESAVFITNRDSTVNFSSYTTFSIPDSVAVISNNQLVNRQRTAFDQQLINAVARNLKARGYTQVGVNNDPDLGVTVSRIYNNFNRVVNYGDYWGYYDNYWDPYYWGYPGYSYYYPSFFGVYTITEGAIEIDMFDLKNAEANNKQLKYVWNGMIRGSGTFNNVMVDSSVTALFTQSPYISR
jgi:hypothetical protein